MSQVTDEDRKKVEALFEGDNIFNASDTDLKTVLRVTSNTTSIDNHWIVRALIVLSIKQDKRLKEVERKNTFLSVIIIILTTVLCYLTWRLL